MKRSKKPLTFVAVAASIGALSMAVEGCVYGPPPTRETNVYGPPPETTIEETDESTKETEETQKTEATKPSANNETEPEVCVYGPPPDDVDGPEVDVYGSPPED